MKVLQINVVNGLGSTGRTCLETAQFLNKEGHEAYIAYAYGQIYNKSYKIGSAIDHKLHSLLSRISGKQAYFSSRATLKLINYVDNIKPDVVHLRNLHGNFVNLKLLLNYLAVNDIPTVISLHDCWFYTGKCTHYTSDNCYKWQNKCGGCPRLKKDNPSWFFDFTEEMLFDKRIAFESIPRLAVVGVSDWITGEARKSFLSNAKILKRIYNWIDLEKFKPVDASLKKQRLGLQNKFIILGVASGWSNAKGLDRFLELAQIIPEYMQIVLVGRQKKNIELPENITQISATSNSTELAEYYSMSDVYLHLSLEETFGKTIAEALACGTPGIVYNSTACPEIIGENTGYIIHHNDIKEIISAIKKIEFLGKSHFSKECILRVNTLFNSKHNIKQTITLYEEICKI